MTEIISKALSALPTFGNIKKFALAHTFISACIGIVILGGAYYGYSALTNTSSQTRYLLGEVTTGTIISSVSASGQVSATSQIDVKPKVSGQITWVGVTPGKKVYAGQALVSIDSTTAQQAVNSAKATLVTSELQYQKDTAQAPFDYQSAENSLQTAKDDLAVAYTNTFDSISSTFLDLPSVTSGMQDVIYGTELSPVTGQFNIDNLASMFSGDDRLTLIPYVSSAEGDYLTAKNSYTESLTKYQSLTRTAATADVDATLSSAINTEIAIAQALQSELNFLAKVNDLAIKYNMKLPSAESTLQTNTRSYLSTVNADLSNLLSQKKTLDGNKQTIATDQNTLALLKVGNQNGSNPITLQISAANLAKQKQDLQNLEDNLANYTVVAPFSGTIASVTAIKGDQTGSSVATIVSDGNVATLSLNEVDAAKLKLNDRATLTFDAVDGLTLTGTIVEIDPVGTVSQGVVSYTVKIGFTAQDARVKPGMTVNAEIQTGVVQNALMVPTSAVKTQNSVSYVLVFTPALTSAEIAAGTSASVTGILAPLAPSQIQVETGLSDDANIQITSGLADGQQVVVRTITGAQATASATTRTASTPTRGGNAGFGGGAVIRGL